MTDLAKEFIEKENIRKVVFCKECLYFLRTSTPDRGVCKCNKKYTSGNMEFYPKDEDYCSYGKSLKGYKGEKGSIKMKQLQETERGKRVDSPLAIFDKRSQF